MLFAPISQAADGSSIFGIVGGNQSTFAGRAKVLGGVEAEAANVADASGTPATIFGAMRLRHVFDHHQFVPAGDVQDRIHIRGLAVEMYRQNSASAFGDGGFDLPDVDVKCPGIDVDIDRGRPNVTNGSH